MKKPLLATLLVLLWPLAAYGAQSTPQATEKAWDAAILHRDSAALKQLLDPHFIDISPQGVVSDRSTALKALTSPVRPYANCQIGEHVRSFGPTVTLFGTYVEYGRAPQGYYRYTVTFADTYVRRHAKWYGLTGQGINLVIKGFRTRPQPLLCGAN